MFDTSADQYLRLADRIVVGTGLHAEGAALYDRYESQRRARLP